MSFDIRNPRWSGVGMIDVDWDHPMLGPITYSAIDGSGEPEMQAIWDAIQRGEYGTIGDAPPPPDPPALLERERTGMVASRFQAKAALLQAGLLADAEAAVEQADALTQLAWVEAVEYRRDSPMIRAIAQALDLSAEQVDDLFRAAMQITV